MSITADGIWAASPSTARGLPTVISSDSKGERIAYASNKSVFVRSIDRPDESRQFSAATNLTVARFAPSGAYIAVGDTVGTVRIWDCLGEGNLKGEYSITSGPINDIAWDGDSARIIAVGNGKQRFGHCITADSGNSVGEISGHSAQINCVAIRQQRPLRAATGSDDLSMVFYHGAPFKFANSERGKHSRYIYGTAFSPDGAHLVTVGADRKIWLYDGKTGEVKKSIGDGDPHGGSIFGVSWARDSTRIATCSADQTVRVWEIESGSSVQTWRMGEQGSVDIAHHQVGITWARDDLIISVDLEGNLNYFSFENPTRPVKIVRGHQKTITAACILKGADGEPSLWTGSYDGKILAWDPSAGLADVLDGRAHSNSVSGLAGSSDARIYSVGWDDSLRTSDAGTKSFVGDVVKTDGQPEGVATASVGAEVLTLVVSDSGVGMYLDGKPIASEKTPARPTCIATGGTVAAVGCDDSTVRLYTISSSSLTLSHSFKPSSTSAPTVLSFSRNSELAIGLANGKILVFAVSSSDAKQVTDRWSAHTARVCCVAWSPDGRFAASGGLDTHIHIWSLADPGKRVKFANAHKELVAGIGWVDDGTLLSAGADAAVRRWKVVV